MTAKEKAQISISKFYGVNASNAIIKECAIILIHSEYFSLREQLINLKSVRIIENDKVYLCRLQELIDEEEKIINEITNYIFQ